MEMRNAKCEMRIDQSAIRNDSLTYSPSDPLTPDLGPSAPHSPVFIPYGVALSVGTLLFTGGLFVMGH